MVFISLEDVVGAVGANNSAVSNCNKRVQCKLPTDKSATQVVVTPGSPAKQQNTPIARAGLFHLSSTHRTSSLEYFVLYVSDSVMRQKWVLSKTSTDHAQLRKSIRRVGSGCKNPACCGHLQRIIKTSQSVSTRWMWGSTPQYNQCNMFQTYVNDLVQVVLGRDTECETMQRTRHLLEDFLDIAHHRANAIDRVLFHDNPAVSPTGVPLKPCEAGQDCGNASDDSSECPICCGDLANDQTLRLPCGHNFHAGCVRVWLNLQHTCPVCRLQLDKAVISN
ncbi:E3 ubiquitin-protein ligase synoviolin [Phytophthora palmivora]|uniref:E3 ubiquitin-protein ligase synoviolin n=1 Tax=Phytophthora palmivora TaxID=4796 RepID=A0A2P4Y573_9STRA|nr:E3 ubiquitin-protein ligase synoviolin [Phytophthora palmivora]